MVQTPEINLEALSELLRHTDKRHKATIRWCKLNSLRIYKVGKRKFVLSNEFYPIYAAVAISNEPVKVEPEIKGLTKNKTMEKIELKKKNAVTGLFLTCTCKKMYKYQELIDCDCTAFKYVARIHIPKSDKGSVKRYLTATNYNDAIIEMAEKRKELESNSYQKIEVKKQVIIPVHKPVFNEYSTAVSPTNNSTILFTEAIKKYMAYLNDTEETIRTKGNNDEAERFFRYAKEALKLAGYRVEYIPFESFDDDMAKFIRVYFKNTKMMSPPYYNKAIGRMSSFFNWTIHKHRLPSWLNLFGELDSPRMKFENNPVAFDVKEFPALLKKVTFENGKTKIAGHNRNLYFPWLKDAFKLGLYTGGRRALITGIKWCDIKFEGNTPQFIKSECYKENLSKNNTNHKYKKQVTDKYKKYFVQTLNAELLEFLLEKGLMRNKGKDEYILAPECERNFIRDNMSRAFPHFYKLLNTGTRMEFKNLRKTNITYKIAKGENLGTGHKLNSKVIMNNYTDQIMIAVANRGKSVFA